MNELIIFGALITGAVLGLPLWHFLASLDAAKHHQQPETDEHEHHHC